ncbi:MAG: DUF5666 domain-containing protein [Terracidiphilus sp.]
MKTRLSFSILLGVALCAAVYGQDRSPAPDRDSAATAGQNGGGQRMRGRRGGGMVMMGRGVAGTISEAAADHFTVKTFEGDVYTVKFGDNTRMMKMQGGMGGRRRMGGGQGMGGNPPETIEAGEIKVGDAIAARGKVDSSAKSVDATTIMLLDPQVAQRMQQMAAEYGKTWLMGQVTDVEGTKVTLMGSQDHAPHSFVVNENTDFRERRNPITLADIKTGDMVRVQGASSDGTFTASSVNVMGMPQRMGNGSGSPEGAGGGSNP